jgi:hypothetical protein
MSRYIFNCVAKPFEQQRLITKNYFHYNQKSFIALAPHEQRTEVFGLLHNLLLF